MAALALILALPLLLTAPPPPYLHPAGDCNKTPRAKLAGLLVSIPAAVLALLWQLRRDRSKFYFGPFASPHFSAASGYLPAARSLLLTAASGYFIWRYG